MKDEKGKQKPKIGHKPRLTKTVDRADLVSMMSKNLLCSKAEAEHILSVTLMTLEQALINHDRIKLVRFGMFEKKVRKARRGRNPQTGEMMDIAPRTVISFKTGEPLLRKIANTGKNY